MKKLSCSIAVSMLLIGCTLSGPVREDVILVSFSAELEEQTPSVFKFRCTLVYPPGPTKGDIWSDSTLAVIVPGELDKTIAFTIDYLFEGMLVQTYRESENRFVLSPVSIRRRSKGTACRAQAVLSVNRVLLKEAKVVAIHYDASTSLGSQEKFESKIVLTNG